MRPHALLATLAVLSIAPPAPAAEVGEPVEVAPRAEATRNQTWPAAAWSAGAKCWLVAWREGYLNELASDVWCARVSADGEALDPAGIRLTGGPGLRDRPRVASDGRDFLVVWEDRRPPGGPSTSSGPRAKSRGSGQASGKDYDVYAARVSGDGKVLDRDGFLVAGGEHNQCRPDAAFAKGNYLVLWMSFADRAYSIRGLRVSPAGRPAGGKPAEIAAYSARRANNPVQAILPAVAANAAGEVLSAFFVTDMYRKRYLARRPVDAATGQPGGALPPPVVGKTEAGTASHSVYRERGGALAMGPDGALAVLRNKDDRQVEKDVTVCLLSKTGENRRVQEIGSPLSLKLSLRPIQPRLAAAFDGRGFLVLSDVLCAVGEAGRRRDPDPPKYARVLGWKVSADGSLETPEGFAVAGEAGRDCLLPAAAAGPEGTCLAVYTEVRGADDAKVLARVVK
jgi:hypothetical protein